MAEELENYWFERTGKGCKPRVTRWQGHALIALFGLAVTALTALLIDRTFFGFLGAFLLAAAIFMRVAAAKTRGELGW